MNRNAAAVIEQAEAYASLFDRVSAGGRFDAASSDGPVRLASDSELLEATASVTRLIRLAEAERVKLTGEIARRSEVPDEASFAKRMGATGATDLVAQVAGRHARWPGRSSGWRPRCDRARDCRGRRCLRSEPASRARSQAAASI